MSELVKVVDSLENKISKLLHKMELLQQTNTRLEDELNTLKNEREKVLQPFYRIEESRNRNTGGIGLGMTIATDIINNHGGKFFLSESPLGGLRVNIQIPT